MYRSFGSNITSIRRDGNCLFRDISYCMYNTKDRHSEIKLSTVNKVINEWKYHKGFYWGICQWSIALKITKIFSPEMGNMVNISN